MGESLVLAAVLVATSFATAVAALLVMHALLGRQRARGGGAGSGIVERADEDAVFLFDDETLVDASERGRALLAATPPGEGEWSRLAAWMTERFPDFECRIAGLATQGEVRLTASGPEPMELVATWRNGLARLALHDPDAEGRYLAVDRLCHQATEEELERLRQILRDAPLPIWRENDAGVVTWANPAYLRLASRRDADAGVLTWPLPQLFPARGAAPQGSTPAAPRRMRVDLSGQGPEQPGGAAAARWFDCAILTAGDAGEVTPHGANDSAAPPRSATTGYALPADAAVRAEAALRDFVQTLTRTFAHLPVGLAIFDRGRRLQLFNPALSDLTRLAPDFLSARPTLDAVFDALRERRMIPEPRDYRAWRTALTEMERAAALGHYQETWSLAGGLTYRVTGRPHPDGAVAFLIEDITAEITLTRRFRAEIDIGKAALDSLEEAIAVFAPSGRLALANRAYRDLWSGTGAAPRDRTDGAMTSAEAIRLWQSRAHPSPHWAPLRILVAAGGPRKDWQEDVQLRDGRHLRCRIAPLPGGATLVGFTVRSGAAAPSLAGQPPLPDRSAGSG